MGDKTLYFNTNDKGDVMLKANKLVFDHVVDINPRTGVIKINNKRMLLAPVDAFGYLRKDLVRVLGMERAKSILMRFGWSSGYVAANAVKAEYPWRSMEELIKAGPSLHTLAGPVMVEMEDLKLQGEQLYLKGSWFYSYEYEEHVRYFEFSNEGTCWTLVGFVRGY